MNYPCCYRALLYLSFYSQMIFFVFNVSLPRRHTKLRFYVENIKNLMTLKMSLQKMELETELMLGKATMELLVSREDKDI